MLLVSVKRRVMATLLMTAAALTAAYALYCASMSAAVPTQSTAASRHVVILDAGHGGTDGGAVSSSGVVESDINLAMTLRLGGVLAFCGRTVVLTRTGEASLCDDPDDALRQQKVSDTRNRVALVNRYPDADLISIHQNSLPGYPEVCGAQVFYNGQDGAADMAAVIQTRLNSAVNQREKTSRAIDGSIYLMAHADCAAVLVECGFLSNPEETILLQQPEYQLHMAAAIGAGYCQYDTSEGTA